jgi:uncharacterized membrane protein YfcA
MNILEFTGLVALGSLLAGFLGALTGLGGGVVVVPMLTCCLVSISATPSVRRWSR